MFKTICNRNVLFCKLTGRYIKVKAEQYQMLMFSSSKIAKELEKKIFIYFYLLFATNIQ